MCKPTSVPLHSRTSAIFSLPGGTFTLPSATWIECKTNASGFAVSVEEAPVVFSVNPALTWGCPGCEASLRPDPGLRAAEAPAEAGVGSQRRGKGWLLPRLCPGDAGLRCVTAGRWRRQPLPSAAPLQPPRGSPSLAPAAPGGAGGSRLRAAWHPRREQTPCSLLPSACSSPTPAALPCPVGAADYIRLVRTENKPDLLPQLWRGHWGSPWETQQSDGSSWFCCECAFPTRSCFQGDRDS